MARHTVLLTYLLTYLLTHLVVVALHLEGHGAAVDRLDVVRVEDEHLRGR